MTWRTPLLPLFWILFVANSLVIPFVMMLCGIGSWATGYRISAFQQLNALLMIAWNHFNRWLPEVFLNTKWVVEGDVKKLSRDQWAILIANHQTWTDIVIIAGTIGLNCSDLKFVVKSALIRIPILGTAMYLRDCPAILRSSKRLSPVQIIKENKRRLTRCAKTYNHIPTTITVYAEGTRFTQAKHDQQQPPYQHLLKPHTSGVAVMQQHMADNEPDFIDVTIDYNGSDNSIGGFMKNRVKTVRVAFDVIPYDKATERPLKLWLNERWALKDKTLANWRK